MPEEDEDGGGAGGARTGCGGMLGRWGASSRVGLIGLGDARGDDSGEVQSLPALQDVVSLCGRGGAVGALPLPISICLFRESELAREREG